MAPADFKQEVRRRGWTYRALAPRWGITENWLSKLGNDPSRSKHWDDAVMGLPYINSAKPAEFQHELMIACVHQVLESIETQEHRLTVLQSLRTHLDAMLEGNT
jgi:hypothetical protein